MNILALLAGLLSGIIGAMGLGGGAVLIIYLTLFADVEQLTAQGINLLFFIPIATVSVIIYGFKKKIKWKTVIKISAVGLIGTLFGWLLADFLGAELISKIFGGFLLLLGIKEIFSKTVAEEKKK
ncbi:MAG: sulfite exporter TauE/SafE family protein [Clostridia bacterium]|nr:sulfite exporter TauE/SafE family protein [Clostridia bacterium]